jgi:arylsulfatase
LTDRVLSLIERKRTAGKSCFAHAHYLALHPRRNWAGHGFNYAGILQGLDGELGRILDDLTEKKMLDRTLLIVTADHGEELGNERGYQGHGFDVTESIIHVPLMVRFPGLEPRQRNDLVRAIDIFATILEYLGVTCPLPAHGRSLTRPALSNRLRFASSAAPCPIFRPDTDLLFVDIHAVYFGDWKLVYNRGSNVSALFRLANDPFEQRNLVDQYPEWVDEPMNLLHGYLSGSAPWTFNPSRLPP